MNAPKVEVHVVNTRREFRETSSARDVICIRILRRKGDTEIDGDWFGTRWQLAPAAYESIALFCNGRAFEWGGGRTCIIVKARSEHADELARYISRVLSKRDSWHHWDSDELKFLPLPALESAA